MSTLRFNPGTYSIIVEASLKSRVIAIANLVVDTGASYVVLPWRLVNTIGIIIDPKKTLQITTATTVETVPKIIIPEMTVLGRTVKNVDAIVKDLPPEAPVDGLLGLSFLRNFKLTIDFPKGILSLE